jgi:signal transduction histidine kinase
VETNKKLTSQFPIDRADLIQIELERKSVELTALKEMGELTSSTLDLNRMLKEIIDTVVKKMIVDICSIYLINKENILVLSATNGLSADAVGKVKLKIGEGITGHTAKTGVPASVYRSDLHPNYVYFAEAEEKGKYSMLSVPMQRDEKTIGVINVQTFNPRHYTTDEISFLSAIASQITGAIRNAQLYEEEKRALDEVSQLYEIGKTISSSLQLEKVLKEITKAGAEILGARGCVLRLMAEDRKGLQIEEVFGVTDDERLPKVLELGESVAGEVATTGKSILVSDIKGARRLKSKFQKKVQSLVCVPIIAKGDVIGTVSVFDKTTGDGKFTRDDERLLMILASQAAICIENARLFETVQRNEHELREIREQLVRVERLAAVGELSAKVAHEIRNPLVSIGGFARKVYDKFPEGTEGKPYLKIVLDEVGRLERILHEILELSSPTLPKMHAMDLHQILEETIFMIHDVSKKKNIKIITKYEATQSIIKVDREQLKQAFLNLFRNSMEAMEGQEGQLKIHTYPSPVEKGKPDRITVAVKDTGCGIPAEILTHIFDPFFSSKPRGSGLGLSITHKIITAHNGTINVESKVNQGTIFIIEFPVYKGKD